MSTVRNSRAMLVRPAPVKNFVDLPGCEFSATGLVITITLKFEEWEQVGSLLRRVESGVQWWLGDWMVYGEHQYKEKYAQAIDASDQTGVNVDTLRNYQWVAERVSRVMRITQLPWSFHQIVAALPPQIQREWLTKALERKLAGQPYTFRELKREVERSERAKNFKLVSTVLNKIWERIQDGCYTPESILKCGECGKDIFDLSAEEIGVYMQQLVGSGKCEWRRQGGKTDVARGDVTILCVPKGMPAGSDFDMPGARLNDNGDPEEHY